MDTKQGSEDPCCYGLNQTLNAKKRAADRVFCGYYQILTRLSGAMYILSPGFTSNAL